MFGVPAEPLQTTRHVKRAYKARGETFAPHGCSIADAARKAADAELGRVFILGKPPGAGVVLAQAQELGRDAHAFLDGHYPTVNCTVDGFQVAVSYAESWFGDSDYDTALAEQMWARLGGAIRHEWKDDTAGMLMSPATTGRDLWQRTVPAEGYPVLPADVQDFVRSVAGQGRMETFPGSRLMPAMYEYDARLAYFACMRRLPVGMPAVYDGADAEAWLQAHPYEPAKVLASWVAPEADRRKPGILPLKVGGDSTAWPRDGMHAGWVDGAELFTARKWGWPVMVHRLAGWTETADPYRTMLARIERMMAHHDHPMWRHACRGIVLYALGAMHGARRKVTHHGGVLPAGAEGIKQQADGSYVWFTWEPASWPEMSHPEWTTTVWARARCRLLDAPGNQGALHLPAGSVIALRTDAVYTTHDAGWTDTGKVGSYVLKATYPGGPRPRSGTDIKKIKETHG